MADPATVSTRAVAPIVLGLRAAGVDAAAALERVGLEETSLTDTEARVSHAKVVELWSMVAELSGDELFGCRVSAMIPPGNFGVVEYAFRKSATVLEGFERIARFFRLGHDVARMSVEVDDERIVFDHTLPGARTLPRAAADFVLSNVALITRDATGGVNPSEVWVDYAPPDDREPLEAHFAAPVRFLRGRRALVYDRASGDAALAGAEPGLCAILDEHATSLLAALPTIGGFADRVRERLAAELCGGDPTAQGMARALKMSVRTLSRRLADEGTSHKQLLEELRVELATRYLGDRQIAIAEVAYLLGFSEPSAFHRAFRRWTGQTPAAFRDS